jgi:phage-related protein
MRTVGPSDVQLDQAAHSGNWLLEITSPSGSTTYRFTNATRDLVWLGNTYFQLPFWPGEIVADARGRAAVEIIVEDVERIMMAVVGANSMIDWTATLDDAWLDSNFDVIAVTRELEGMVDQIDYDSTSPTNQFSISLIASFAASQVLPGERFVRPCRYRRFKGPRCGYTGPETTCDRSFARCTELSNTQRFGGFRFLPDPGKKIMIGTHQSTVPDRAGSQPLAPIDVKWGEW